MQLKNGEIKLTKQTKLEISSKTGSNMNNSESNENLDIQLIVEYIAKTSQQIVNEMKKQDVNQVNFEESIQKIKDKSEVERGKYKNDFNEKREEIRRKFNNRRR